MKRISDLHITGEVELPTPYEVSQRLPSTDQMNRQVAAHRAAIQAILRGDDRRLLVIAGPCSIFNKQGTVEFGRAFKRLADQVSDQIFMIMRCPPDKPRSISGPGQWEGMIHEPEIVGKSDPVRGIHATREVLRDLVALGLPIAIEFLDTRRPQFLDDLVSLSWTGARAVEYGALRRLASGLSWPVGFKNRTDGALKPAFDAIQSANHPNSFDGMSKKTGRATVEQGEGNPDAFLILRGAEHVGGQNYSYSHVSTAQHALRSRNLSDFVVVDCAHGNCLDDAGKKDPRRQLHVLESVLSQRLEGNLRIGTMLEAYLREGKQDVLPGVCLEDLRYDVSPTDPTISVDQLVHAIQHAHGCLSREAQAA